LNGDHDIQLTDADAAVAFNAFGFWVNLDTSASLLDMHLQPVGADSATYASVVLVYDAYVNGATSMVSVTVAALAATVLAMF